MNKNQKNGVFCFFVFVWVFGVSLCLLVTKQEFMKQPVRTPCSHTFDRVSIESWFKSAPNGRELRRGRYTMVKDIWNKNHKNKQTKKQTNNKQNN